MDDIFRKEDALEFKQEKVKQLLEIIKHSLNCFLRNRVVFAGTEGAREALGEDEFAGDFKSGHC